MKITQSDINREGFAILHGKWGGSQGCIFGLNGKMKNEKCKMKIGYMAYPNPTLKNKIPDSRFYKYENLIKLKSPPVIHENFQTYGRLEQSVTKKEYIKKILRIKELLAAGEIYQLNYAIRFRKKFKNNPYALFLKLVEINPTDFSAYLNCGDFQIISSSPERLFKVQNKKIITQPIKGTADKKSLKYLLNSEKEKAELDMITDLERNDIGKICKYGTLKLVKERRLLKLKNIWHTYSEVEGRLESTRLNRNGQELQFHDIIQAMFPGGSITGCPKKRAMEYIEKLEGMPRNIFTGSIGYISNGGAMVAPLRCSTIVDHKSTTKAPQKHHNWSMDFNIAIRTALVHNGYIEYWAGGGIVADSDPEKEYEECMLKAEKFLKLI